MKTLRLSDNIKSAHFNGAYFMHMLCLRTSDTDTHFKNKTVNVSYSKNVFPVNGILNLAIVPLSDLIQKRVNITH